MRKTKPVHDIVGVKFGRLTVLHRSGTKVHPNGTSKPTWLCMCDCGNTHEATGQALKLGNIKSCGCLKLDFPGNLKHGMTHTPTHQTWRGMKERCDNPRNSHYKSYGAVGVTYDPRWASFENFYADMGPRPEGTTLDRFPDRFGNYEKGNCRWATTAEQSRNTSRTVLITWNGVTKCLKDWAADLGITGCALRFRLKHWTLERAMTTGNLAAAHDTIMKISSTG